MFEDPMPTLLIFVTVASLAGIVGLLMTGGQGKVDRRIDQLTGHSRRGKVRGPSVGRVWRSRRCPGSAR